MGEDNAIQARRRERRTHDFDEWRKHEKYLRHRFELVRPAGPEVLEAMAATASEIGDELGTDHVSPCCGRGCCQSG